MNESIINKVNRKINRKVISLLPFVSHYLSLLCKHFNRDKRILILINTSLGDCILSLDAISHIVDHYIRENHKILVVCRYDMKFLIEATLENKTEIIGVDMTRDFFSLREYFKFISKMREFSFEKIFVLFPNVRLWHIVYGIYCDNVYTMCYREWYECRRKIARHIIDSFDVYYPNDNDFFPNALGGFVENVLDEEYQPQRIYLKNIEKLENGVSNYIIFSPFSSSLFRNLSNMQICEIIEYILCHKDYNIVISGGKGDWESVNEIIKNYDGNRVINYCGKTSLKEFISLIKGSYYLIGPDSGHIHLAAVTRIPSIALAGWWQKEIYLPYNYKLPDKSDPVCIRSEKSYICRDCYRRGGIKNIGEMNTECAQRVKNRESFLCLSQIKMDKVFEAIDKMDEYVKNYEQ